MLGEWPLRVADNKKGEIFMANNVDYKLTPTLNSSTKKIEWKMCLVESGQDKVCGSKDGDYPNLELGKGKGAYVLQFRIDDPAKLGIKFAANPLNIKTGNPNGADSQITIPAGGGGTVMTFTDLNTLPSSAKPAAVKITYGLNFVDKNNKAVTAIDPDLTNGGTGNRFDFADYLLPVGAGLLAGMALMFLYRKFFGNGAAVRK
jgi:hypothetical protein